jgi:hypothetical protein
MTSVHNRVNLIPLIAKADTFTQVYSRIQKNVRDHLTGLDKPENCTVEYRPWHGFEKLDF